MKELFFTKNLKCDKNPELNPTKLLEKFDQLIERHDEDDAVLAMLSWLYLAKQFHAHGGEETRRMIELSPKVLKCTHKYS